MFGSLLLMFLDVECWVSYKSKRDRKYENKRWLGLSGAWGGKGYPRWAVGISEQHEY